MPSNLTSSDPTAGSRHATEAQLLAIYIVIDLITLVLVPLRIWARKRTTGLGWDDHTIVGPVVSGYTNSDGSWN